MNFLTLMGYSMSDGREMYGLEEIVREFDPARIGASPAVFSMQKLDWMNQHYLIQNVPQDKLWERIKEWSFKDDFMQRLMPLCHTRMKTFGEFIELADFLFVNHLKYTPELFEMDGREPWHAACMLQTMIWAMDSQENWQNAGFNQASRDVAAKFQVNHKKVVIPILYASLMGRRQGLPLFDSVDLLGKDRVRARLLLSIEFLGGLSSKKTEALKSAWERGEVDVATL